MHYYKVFGLTMGSQENFSWPLEQINSPAEIACEITQTYAPLNLTEWNLFYTSSVIHSSTHQPLTLIFSSERGILLVYPNFCYFEIQPSKITYHLQDHSYQLGLEGMLFRFALALWLELIGILTLHASGIFINGSAAIGFLANSGSGKSTLAAAFVRTGAQFLTDDIFPVEMEMRIKGYRVRPSYAWLRLQPETAKALGYPFGQSSNNSAKLPVWLDKAYGELCSEPVPLGALYLPIHKDDIDTVLIRPLSPKQAYLALIQHSFIGKWLIKSPLNARHLSFLSQLIRDIPIKELVYPSGYQHLPIVMDAVKRDISA